MALVTMGLSPSFLRRATFAAQLPGTKKGKVLICLFQRGAADGLSMVVPHGAPTTRRVQASPFHVLAPASPTRPWTWTASSDFTQR
jgi:uncharacterized protein (DUF1501 family)